MHSSVPAHVLFGGGRVVRAIIQEVLQRVLRFTTSSTQLGRAETKRNQEREHN